MEKLLCKTCGSRHWTREPCPAVKPGKISDVTVLEPVRPAPKRLQRQGRVIALKRAREAVATSGGPLSDAERARRYRVKGGEQVREANRLRMAAKRRATPGI